MPKAFELNWNDKDVRCFNEELASRITTLNADITLLLEQAG